MFGMNLIYKRQPIIFTIIICITTVFETRYTSDRFLAAEVLTICIKSQDEISVCRTGQGTKISRSITGQFRLLLSDPD